MVVHSALSPEKRSGGNTENSAGALWKGTRLSLILGCSQDRNEQMLDSHVTLVLQMFLRVWISLQTCTETQTTFLEMNVLKTFGMLPSTKRAFLLDHLWLGLLNLVRNFMVLFLKRQKQNQNLEFLALQQLSKLLRRPIPVETLEPIWEQRIWGVMSGNKQLIDVYKPFGISLKRPVDTLVVQGSSSTSEPSSTRAKTGVPSDLSYHGVVQDRLDSPWQEQRDADLQSSVKFWLALVNRCDIACSVGGSMLQLAVTSGVFGMFAHLIAGRSPVTTRKGSYSIMRLCYYLENKGGIYPCSKDDFHDFLCREQTANAPQSRLKGYMQPINLCFTRSQSMKWNH